MLIVLTALPIPPMSTAKLRNEPRLKYKYGDIHLHNNHSALPFGGGVFRKTLERMREETQILDLIDSQITDREFEENLSRIRFLKKCKKLGFPDLKKKGLIKFPTEKPKRPYKMLVGEHRERCLKKVLEVNALRKSGMRAMDACEKAGVHYQTYADWAYRLEMKLPRGYNKNMDK